MEVTSPGGVPTATTPGGIHQPSELRTSPQHGRFCISGSREIRQRVCKVCGRPIAPPSGPGRPPAYCSDACRRRADADRRVAARRPSSLRASTGQCLRCASPTPQGPKHRPRLLFCSPECRERASKERLSATRRLARSGRRCRQCQAPITQGRGRPSAYCSRRCANRGFHGVREADLVDKCRGCDRSVLANNGRQWCSRECRDGTLRWAERGRVFPCPECGTEISTTDNRRVFCSALCFNRAKNRRLWAAGSRRKFPTVRGRRRVLIAERDGWRCGFCHAVIDPGLRWPHPGSLSIDHIDPNGAHEPANWQASHLACNVQAGAKRAAA